MKVPELLPRYKAYETIKHMNFRTTGNNKSTFGFRLRNKDGQVALFIALIFQILFLFFAMVINVGLLIHHKINLQNSVDLAAYYGAMKQAENLNAVGHINYQIRQSWKLLTWRYRMIGSAGEWTVHPYDKMSPATGPRGGDEDVVGNEYPDFYNAPTFCATYVPFKPMPKDENTCRTMATNQAVVLFKIPTVIAGFQGFTQSIRLAGMQYLSQATRQCKIAGTFNYILLGSFAVAYNIDQADRSLLITQIARTMSEKTDDFYDIDGQSVKEGIKKTLENNLTVANRESIQNFETYNSLGHEGCNNSGRTGSEPPKWLSSIRVYPAFAYMDSKCENAITGVPKALTNIAADMPGYLPEASADDTARVDQLSKFLGLLSPLNNPYNFSVGVEKNPWCVPYVGVKATTMPSIPFSFLGSVQLVAKSFAKPFGGRIGPWYNANWAPSAEMSNGGAKIDDQLPPRVRDLGDVGDPNDRKRVPNYSRFVGDKFGLKTRRVLYQFGKAIYELDPSWKARNYQPVRDGRTENLSDEAPNFNHWEHIPFNFAKKEGGNGDILAWDSKGDQPSRMRELELTAILPDTFDMAYYSIEPDYYNNYFKRLRDGFMKTAAGSKFDKSLRPDIGHHKGYVKNGVDLENFSVKDQYRALKTVTLENTDIDNKLTYLSKRWDHVLTGWADKDLLDFSLDKDRFGHCLYPDASKPDGLPVPTSGNCVTGGTTGYSVKSVASDYLKSTNLQLGGDNSGQGALKNPPPDDF